MTKSVLLFSNDNLIISILRHFFAKENMEIIIVFEQIQDYIINEHKNFSSIIIDNEWKNEFTYLELNKFLTENSIIVPLILLYNDISEINTVDASNRISFFQRNLSEIEEIIKKIKEYEFTQHTVTQTINKEEIIFDNEKNDFDTTIFLADDSRQIRKYVTRLLSERNYNIESFENGQELLDRLYEKKHCDLIILDNQMPVKDGISTLIEIKKHDILRKIPVLFLSAVTDKDQVVQALEMGADDYIQKPFHNNEFFARLNVHLKIDKMKKELIEKNEQITLQKNNIQEKLEEITVQKEEIEQQKHEIEKKNKDITSSIQYALRIQNAVMSGITLINNLFSDFFVLNKPRDIVSGDFYYIKENEQHICVAAADCTGHGVPGAFMSMLGSAFLNEIFGKCEYKNAACILESLREKVKNSLHQTGKSEEQKDGMDIALCLIDKQTMKMHFSGAYNPLYMITKKVINNIPEAKIFEKDDTKLQILPGSLMPIGVHKRDTKSFTNYEIQIQNGDSIYIFSDGYVSQFGGSKGLTFKTSHFKDLILDIQGNKMSIQKEILEKTLMQWQGDAWEQVDDILVLGIKFVL